MTPPPDANDPDPTSPPPARPAEPGSTAGRTGTPLPEIDFTETDLKPVPAAADQALGRPQAPSEPLPVPAVNPVGRTAGSSAALPPLPVKPTFGPAPTEDRNRARFLTFLRLISGWLVLAGLAYFMWTPGDWPTRLMAWVFLAILADEFAGWFGYIGLALGGLGYFSPTAPPEQWLVILPLVGGALFALLLLKHAGGPFVLPFAGALYAGTLLGVARVATKFDPAMKLPSNDTFLRSALLAMAVGLGLSFIRQFIEMFMRRQARVRARRQAEAHAIPT